MPREKIVVIDRENLKKLYLNRKFTIQQIADTYSCNWKTVQSRLKEYKIPLRGRGGWQSLPFTSALLNREFLEEKYVKEGLTAKQIAQIVGCHAVTILRHLKKNNINIRGQSEAQKGKTLSRETRDRISESGKGKNKGMKRPDLSEYNRNRDYSFLNELRKKPEFEAKRLKKWLAAIQLSPNKVETTLCNFLTHLLPGEYKYTGNSLIIGGLVPDFTNCNGKKKIIELFGRTFHDPNKTFKENIPWKGQEFGRKAVYSQLGYDTLIIWDDELNDLESLKEKILKFNEEYNVC